MKKKSFLLIGFAFILATLAGCGEQVQKEALDSQAAIEKERKATGDDKNAY